MYTQTPALEVLLPFFHYSNRLLVLATPSSASPQRAQRKCLSHPRLQYVFIDIKSGPGPRVCMCLCVSVGGGVFQCPIALTRCPESDDSPQLLDAIASPGELTSPVQRPRVTVCCDLTLIQVRGKKSPKLSVMSKHPAKDTDSFSHDHGSK